jgi:hypothetical protein
MLDSEFFHLFVYIARDRSHEFRHSMGERLPLSSSYFTLIPSTVGETLCSVLYIECSSFALSMSRLYESVTV